MTNQNSELKSPLKCSIFWSPNKKSKKLLLYNHCFSGNKLEGIPYLDYTDDKYSLLCYDLRGTGNNMSEYVTLGLRESLDLLRIIKYVIKNFDFKEIFLWGRSMGATTVIHLMHDLEFYIKYYEF